MKIKVFVLSLLILILSACQSTRIEPNMSMMDHFEEGKTTYQEVVGVMGKPNAVTMGSSGLKTIVYSKINTEVDPATFIPFVGAFVGGASSEMKMITFVFENDVLKKMNYMESSSEYNALGN